MSVINEALQAADRECTALRDQIASLTKRLEEAARYSNPWTVEVRSVDGHWQEMCHDAPLTLSAGEKRRDEHLADSPEATFRVTPWYNAMQRQDIALETASLKQIAEEADTRFRTHTKAVETYLNELYAIMVDPLADGVIKVQEVMVALKTAALRDREAEQELADFRAREDDALARMLDAIDNPDVPRAREKKLADALARAAPLLEPHSAAAQAWAALAEYRKALPVGESKT